MTNKKILDNPFWAPFVVPAAIILVGSLIIFGVTKMLSTDKNHRDLVRELETKTFGNRWVAAFELSKLLAAKKIPAEEKPWVLKSLSDLYLEGTDDRTRHFLVLAIGALDDEKGIPLLVKALKDPDPKVAFSAVTAIGNSDIPKSVVPTQALLEVIKTSKDEGLVQASLYALTRHQVDSIEPLYEGLLSSEHRAIRFAAAIGLIRFHNSKGLRTLEEILTLDQVETRMGDGALLRPEQVDGLKVSVLKELIRVEWPALKSFLQEQERKEKNMGVKGLMKEYLAL